MQKGIAGYNILTLLSMVDGKPHKKEDLVIKDWLVKEFDFSKNLDDELHDLTMLDPKEYEAFLQQQMDHFFPISTLKERNELIQFAIHLIKADGKIEKGENELFDYLFHGWNEGE